MLQISTHRDLESQIIAWKYPYLTRLATLSGHSLRVLYMAVSPNGESIVTGDGDEILRFWNVFSRAHSQKGSA
jgi:cell division cycle 20-like protein 1 (cofactor of APC complex)